MKPTRVRDKWAIPTQRYLMLAVREFFKPVRNATLALKENVNSREAFEHLFQIGKIKYVEGVFIGEIPAEISLFLKEHGAQWDYMRRGWRLPLAMLPPRVTFMIEAQKKKDDEVRVALLAALAIAPAILDAFLSGPELFTHAEEIAEKVRILAELPPAPPLPSARALPFDNRVREAMQRWAQREAERVAADLKRIEARGGDVAEYLRKREDAAEYRARLVARREMAVEANNTLASGHIAEGRAYYRWHTMGDTIVRPDHADLDNSVQRWDDPPIVNTHTGMRGHPSEDFNCRCVAIPLETA